MVLFGSTESEGMERIKDGKFIHKCAFGSRGKNLESLNWVDPTLAN
jgi:hypothetical protein